MQAFPLLPAHDFGKSTGNAYTHAGCGNDCAVAA